jgi:hypothetical protein
MIACSFGSNIPVSQPLSSAVTRWLFVSRFTQITHVAAVNAQDGENIVWRISTTSWSDLCRDANVDRVTIVLEVKATAAWTMSERRFMATPPDRWFCVV